MSVLGSAGAGDRLRDTLALLAAVPMGDMAREPLGEAHWGKATLLTGLVLASLSPPLPCQGCQNWACFSFCHVSIVRFHAGLGKKANNLSL